MGGAVDASSSLDAPLLLKENQALAQEGRLERGGGVTLPPGFVDGCPGCLLQLRKSTRLELPRKELFIMAVIMLSTALPISSLYPFLYFMVRDTGIAKLDTSIGWYAGYVGASLMFGRFLTSTPWGIVADKYGRKPVLVWGTASVVVFNTLFGFSQNYWMVLSTRFILGITNGVMGTVPAYASEICREEHQAVGLSVVGTMWGLGLIVGPAIGGYLAQPADKYPNIFPTGSIFYQYPYALPCLCISLFALVGLIISFWLPESGHKHQTEKNNEGEKVEIQVKNRSLDAGNEDEKVQDTQTDPISKKQLWRNHGLVAAVAVYCLWGLHDMSYSEIFSLWAVSPTLYGGLAFTTSELGDVLTASGAALLLFQFFVFPRLARLVGAIRIAQIPTLLTVPLIAAYPLISKLDGSALWGVLITASIIKNLFSTCVMTGSFILINNSVVSLQRGVANGVATSFLSLFRAIGPACAGAIFSWAEERLDASFLPGMWLVFAVLALFSFVTFISTIEPILPKSLNKPIPEDSIEIQDEEEEILTRASSFTF